MDHSILEDIKKLVGSDVDDVFDTDLMIHINSALGILTQVGVGPANGFFADSNSTWNDFTQDAKLIPEIRSFVYLQVRLLFDPPQSAAAIESMRTMSQELVWRIRVKAETE